MVLAAANLGFEFIQVAYKKFTKNFMTKTLFVSYEVEKNAGKE
jgi:hypothetical protein